MLSLRGRMLNRKLLMNQNQSLLMLRVCKFFIMIWRLELSVMQVVHAVGQFLSSCMLISNGIQLNFLAKNLARLKQIIVQQKGKCWLLFCLYVGGASI